MPSPGTPMPPQLKNLSRPAKERSRPIRVGIDYRPALLSRSGIARSVRELARALASREKARKDNDGRDIDVRRFGHSLARCRVGGSEDGSDGGLHRLPIPGRTLPWLHKLGLGADRLCGGCDVFHWTDFIYPPLTSARAVVTVHDVSFAEAERFHGPAQSRVLRERCATAIDRAARVITPTHATAAALVRHFGAEQRVVTIPFGADHLAGSASGTNPHPRPYILAVGTVEPRKNYRRLLEAWRQLDSPCPDLVVIGRAGWEEPAVLDALHDATRTEPGVVWLRSVADPLARRFFAHARVLAYPSILEGFGFPPLEACSLGVPVLAGDTRALREVCGDAVAYCDPNSTESIREGLETLLRDEGERQRLSHIGPKQAARYRWSDCAVAHARVYAEAAE